MKLIFVDDSKQSATRAHISGFTALGGVAFDESQLRQFANEFWSIYDQHGVPHEAELKWSPDSKTSWFSLAENKHHLTPVREAVIAAAARTGARAVVVAWETSTSGFQGLTPDRLVLKFLYERVGAMLENDAVLGAFVFDRPGGGVKDQDSWLDGSLALTDGGTEYVTASSIVMPILTASSHHHPHLQFADLLVGATTAALVGNRYGQALIPILKPLFHTNGYGTIGGTGLKLWPNNVTNLHHWVMGEDTFVKMAMNSGFALPNSSFGHFGTDDGLTV